MKLLVDMNLSPEWLKVLSRAGWQAIHWSTAGPATAADTELLAWARDHNYVVLTQDLDFGQLLFHTR
jgi:predicted nuclease of predicted toxin-antitoxin system